MDLLKKWMINFFSYLQYFLSNGSAMEPRTAVLCTVCYSAILIGLFYTHPIFRPKVSQTAFRFSVMILMACLSIALSALLGSGKPVHIFCLSGFSLLCDASTIALFLGPILQKILGSINAYSEYKKETPLSFISKKLASLLTFDSFIELIGGPMTEEIIYRYFTCNLWTHSSISAKKTIWLSPLIFGLAHFHKFFASLNASPMAKRQQLFISIFQCGFTTVFGWWAAFAWCETRSISTVFFLHSFCNFMQFPDFGSALNWSNHKQKEIIIGGYAVGICTFAVLLTLLIQLMKNI